MTERELLEEIYKEVLRAYREGQPLTDIDSRIGPHCNVIVENQERAKGVLAVTITLLVKKLYSPEQDIRMHQARMQGGFSGRGLDTRAITPFLRERNFPYMSGGTGWLTRSLEQPFPYTLNYEGRISPSNVKTAFLSIIDGVQTRGISADQTLRHILWGLIELRERSASLALARPVNLSIAETVDKIRLHHSANLSGVSRLPVLAVYSILRILAREMERYDGCTVLPLEHHTASDARTALIGDVHVVDSEGTLFEGYEVKHNLPITSQLIQTSFEKFRTTPVDRFYILTTYDHGSYSEFAPDIQRVANEHGCQLIVNGVDQTLMYYLRLIKGTREFVHEYVSSIESDAAVGYQLKAAWNEIAQT